jgi:hypothetical protein
MYEWVWSIGGMILTGETEVLGEKHCTALVVDGWMSMEHWWNDTDRRSEEHTSEIQSPYRISFYDLVCCLGCYVVWWYSVVLGEKHYTALVVDVWMSMEHWWNDTDRGNCSTGKHYTASVVDEWMSMEHWWNYTDRGNCSTGKHYTASVVHEWMSMEHWWNDTDRGTSSLHSVLSQFSPVQTTTAVIFFCLYICSVRNQTLLMPATWFSQQIIRHRLLFNVNRLHTVTCDVTKTADNILCSMY